MIWQHQTTKIYSLPLEISHGPIYSMRKPWFWLSLFILSFSFQIYPSSATLAFISTNQTLSGDQVLLSKDGIFELGFFKPGNSSNYYICMWYKKVSQRTIVWVANRDNPVSDKNTAKLTILEGNLVLLDESQSQVWSTNLSSPTSGSVVATLLDNGNLILNDSDASDYLWQSFDHPTDTFLPGSKLKLDKKTKQPQYLTSWKNSEDPGTGLYSLELDPEGSTEFLILRNKSVKYWTSGTWNGQIFSLVPEMRLNYIFNFSFVSNENESYFTYSLYNTSITSRLIMDVSGQIKQQTWLESTQQWNLFWSQPRQQCDVDDFCGAFGSCSENSLPYCSCLTGFVPKSQSEWNLHDYSGGCQRSTRLQCESFNPSNGDYNFRKISNMALPKYAETVRTRNFEDCESICLNNCSCSAYAYNSNRCSIWNGDLLNLKQLSSDDSSGETLYLKLAASDLPNAGKGKSKRRLSLILGIPIASVVVILTCATVYAYIRKRKIAQRQEREMIQRYRGRFYDSEREVKDLIDEGHLEEKDNEGIEVPYFDFDSIIVATDNFSLANKLGRGGYGPVYKGKLQDGQVIAVKRLSSASKQGFREFKNEVILIAKLQHRNLVRLRGYCIKGEEKILLYEYMPNRSLDSFIFVREQGVLLDWQMRFDIIRGIARGMLYLHQDSRLRVIHRDLKTSNILLDKKMQPKISDFGLAKIFGGKETEGNSEMLAGTYGYMAPESATKGLFSAKSDVFSFGVVLLEIISGKKNMGFYESEQISSLMGYAWRLWTEERLLDLMDSSLCESCNMNQFTRSVHIGLLCVQDDPNDRPSMSNVVTMLGIETLPDPKQPTFYERRVPTNHASSSKLATTLQLDSIYESYQDGR
ncbi:putative protein kinase RLK-Pelle-DLSV family [Lupinus albus]|uniref:Receptor-like serine/threonine-protein kinase n=1 Tax=Lupinus albus TaxID=3870 RepID=A0A6A4P1T1_LUPAL|nr:putative protein kinase RLK-Pelle-DLSV family [Lupinus albus]